jgi:hypothetical protein
VQEAEGLRRENAKLIQMEEEREHISAEQVLLSLSLSLSLCPILIIFAPSLMRCNQVAALRQELHRTEQRLAERDASLTAERATHSEELDLMRDLIRKTEAHAQARRVIALRRLARGRSCAG